jgi:putative methionine-R-sulfoxide reductase with GAF domain/signal transduction histidine kinase
MFQQKHKRDQGAYRTSLQALPRQTGRIMAMIRDEKPIDEICREVLRVGVNLTQSPPQLAYIRIIDRQSGGTLHICTLDSSLESSILQTTGRGVTGRAFQTGLPQVVGDVSRDRDYVPLDPRVAIRSELAVPLMLGGACSGVMNFESTAAHWFSESDADQLMWLAQLVALANALDVQRVRDDAAAVLGIDPAGQELKSRLAKILDDVLDLFTPPTGIMAEVMGLVPDSRELITLVIRPDAAAGLPIRLREGEGVIGQVLKTGRAFTGDVIPDGPDITHLLNTRSIAAIPVFDRAGKMLGVLNLESRQPNQLGQATIALLRDHGILTRLADILDQVSQEPASSQEVAERLLKLTQEQVLAIVDPDDLDETYHAILTNAAQLTGEIDVVGGILLLREEAQIQNSASVPAASRWVTVVARLGDYAPDNEWSLNEPSITRMAIEQRSVQLVTNVSKRSDYKTAGSRFESGSELNVPLIDQGQVIGVLDLVSPVPGAFTQDDADNLERLALSVVQAVKRANDIAQKERASRQLNFAITIQRMTQPLFSSETIDVGRIREQVVGQILQWATEKTDSELGVIMLAQRTSGRPTELVVSAAKGTMAQNAPSRWLASQGVTGRAFTLEQTLVEQDVSTIADRYIELFPGARSEMAVPLRRGGEILGVLNVESDSLHHYTIDHRQWGEFLAELLVAALTAIDLALHTQRELSAGGVSDRADDEIDALRLLNDLDQIRPQRNLALQHLLDDAVRLTGASSGTILLSVNAYHLDGSKDFERGQLVEVIESPARLQPLPEMRYFSVNAGLSGRVFRFEKLVVFNSLDTRPPEYYSYADDPRQIESELAVPIFEGPYIVGVLDLESTIPGTFTGDNVELGTDLGQIASDIIVSAKVRAEELQADELRDFELSILRRRTPDLSDYMREVLSNAARLTETHDGLAEILLLRYFPGDDGSVARQDMRYRLYIASDSATLEEPEVPTKDFEHDHPAIVYSIYKRVIETQESWLSLDAAKDPLESNNFPWPGMRSFLCTPIIYPGEDGTERAVNGLLTLASANPTNFNDSDDEVLYLFTQTIAIGLQNIALLQAREDLLKQVTHDFGKALVPLARRMSTINQPVDRALAATSYADVQRDLTEVRSTLDTISDLVFLLRDLMYSFIDLFSENRRLQEEVTYPLAVGGIAGEMRDSTNALGDIISGRKVIWQVDAQPIYVAGSESRENLIKAVLFKYIENALKYATAGDVLVRISAGLQRVTFAVRNTGPLVSETERASLFRVSLRGSNIPQSTFGSGLGLSQVREIAAALGGSVAYLPEEPDQNVFVFTLPTVPAPTLRRER